MPNRQDILKELDLINEWEIRHPATTNPTDKYARQMRREQIRRELSELESEDQP